MVLQGISPFGHRNRLPLESIGIESRLGNDDAVLVTGREAPSAVETLPRSLEHNAAARRGDNRSIDRDQAFD